MICNGENIFFRNEFEAIAYLSIYLKAVSRRYSLKKALRFKSLLRYNYGGVVHKVKKVPDVHAPTLLKMLYTFFINYFSVSITFLFCSYFYSVFQPEVLIRTVLISQNMYW